MILEKGFDINVRTSRGTALHEAAICGKVRPLRTRRDHATYSITAFSFNIKVDVVKVLLSGDIDLDLRDSGDKTVLDVMEDIKTPVSLEITDVIIGTSYLFIQ